MGKSMHPTTNHVRIQQMERAKEIIDLRLQKFTFAEIQAITGIDPSNAAKTVKRYLREAVKPQTEELLQVELAALDRMTQDTWSQAFEPRPERDDRGNPIIDTVFDSQMQPVLNPDGTQKTRVRRDEQSATAGKLTLLKIADHRAKLTGIYAPVRNNNTVLNLGADGMPVEVKLNVVDAGIPEVLRNLPPDVLDELIALATARVAAGITNEPIRFDAPATIDHTEDDNVEDAEYVMQVEGEVVEDTLEPEPVAEQAPQGFQPPAEFRLR